MADPIQETSHAADSSSSNPPVLEPIGSGDDLSNYKMTCNIESVYYYSHNKHPTTCAAILLNFGFNLAGVSLKFVKFPTRVVGVPILDGFPLSEQLIFDSSKHEHERAILLLVRSFMGHLDGIMWRFFIRDCYSPCSVKILLDVENYEDLPYPFRFSLQIPPQLEICVKPKSWWHFWTTNLRTKNGHQGWSCNIEEDYHPDIAKNVLLKYKKLREEMDHWQSLGLGIMNVYGYDLELLPT